MPSDTREGRPVRITTDRDIGSGWLPWHGGAALPRRFSAKVEGDWLPGIIELEIHAHERDVQCASLTVRGLDDAHPVTARGIRDIPLNALVRMATALELAPMELAADGSVSIHVTAPLAGRVDLAYRRRPRLADDDLRETAEIYRAAVAAGEPPTRAVELRHSQAPLSRKTAGRWVQLARERGFLAPVKGG